MKQEFKKTIAREFLIVITVFILTLISFLSIYPYNWFKSKQIKSISESINLQDKILDSLSNSYKKKSNNQDWLYNKFGEGFEESVKAAYRGEKSDIMDLSELSNVIAYINKYKIIQKPKNTVSEYKNFFDIAIDVSKEQPATSVKGNNNDPLGILKPKKQTATTKAQGEGSYIDLKQVTPDLFDNSKQNTSFATDFWNNLYTIHRNDSISTYWDKIWPKQLVTFFITFGFKNSNELNRFIKTNTIYTTETELKDSIQKQKDVAVQKKGNINNSILSSDEQKQFALNGLLFFFIFLFPLRYLYYGVKWSLSTLKN